MYYCANYFTQYYSYIFLSILEDAFGFVLGPSIKYVRKIFRKTNISNPDTHTYLCVSGG